MSNRVYPLADEWKNELKVLAGDNNYDHFSRLIAVIHTSETIIDKLGTKKRSPYKLDSLQMITTYYFAHTFHQAASIYHLSKLGFGAGGLILIRSMIESVINLCYLWQCKKINGTDEERLAWMDYVYVLRNKMDVAWGEMQNHRKKMALKSIDPKDLFTDDKSRFFQINCIDFKNKYGRDYWAKYKKIEQRARKVDDTQQLKGIVLEQEYNSCYRWSSELVHGMSAGSNLYIDTNDQSFNIDFGANYKNVDIVLPMTSRFLFIVIEMVNHLFHLEIDLESQIFESGFTNDRWKNLKI